MGLTRKRFFVLAKLFFIVFGFGLLVLPTRHPDMGLISYFSYLSLLYLFFLAVIVVFNKFDRR